MLSFACECVAYFCVRLCFESYCVLIADTDMLLGTLIFDRNPV